MLTPEQTETLINSKMAGSSWSDFERLNILGEGGEGLTAKDEKSERWMVVKVMKGTADGMDEDAREELALIIGLEHPNVLGVTSVFK